ncbi:MAG TPA: hypothetical protein VN495_02115 [Candidatus Paceibacterota bacterium]|nr:hypothetical protein [Candidatus Paceibacterota bacterium]
MEGIPGKRTESVDIARNNEIIAKDFLRIDDGQLQHLRNRIALVNGHVRIAVHPLFIARRPGSFSDEKKEKTGKEVHDFLSRGFSRTVESVVKNPRSAPLFIFEEYEFLSQSAKEVAKIGHIAESAIVENGMLFFPTEQASGYLWGERAARAYERVYKIPDELSYDTVTAQQKALLAEVDAIHGKRNMEDLWTRRLTDEEFGEVLKDTKKTSALLGEYRELRDKLDLRRNAVLKAACETLGVRSALVSGAYFFEYNDPKSQEAKRLAGCAGGVTETLRQDGVRVDISRFSWEEREELAKKGFETKQTGKEQHPAGLKDAA